MVLLRQLRADPKAIPVGIRELDPRARRWRASAPASEWGERGTAVRELGDLGLTTGSQGRLTDYRTWRILASVPDEPAASPSTSAPGAEHPRQASRLQRLGAYLPRFSREPSTVRTALAGYLVVSLFALAFGAARILRSDDTNRSALIVAALAAAPLALALIWSRLATLRAFGVEVTLASVVVKSDNVSITEVLSQEYFSGLDDILRQTQHLVRNPEISILRVDLGSFRRMWTTRLFLQAALCENHSFVQRLVFVDGDAGSRYIGMATPMAVRRGLGQHFPYLEDAFRRASDSIAQPLPPGETLFERIPHNWTMQFPMAGGRPESDLRVTADQLALWLGSDLEDNSVWWDDSPEAPLLRYLVLERATRFVAIVRNGRLERVVNADDLSRRQALATARVMMH